MALAYIEKVTTNQTAFEIKVRDISSRLGINPDWLMIVMYAESKLNHLIKSPNSSAVGLIQFTASTAKNLGVSSTQLLSMSNVQQLDYVEKYYKSFGFANKLRSVYDCYFAVFAPLGVGQSDNKVLYASPTSAYNANKALDIDKNGNITVKDVKIWFSKYIPVNIKQNTATNTNLYTGFAVVTLAIIFRKKIKKLLKS